MSSVPARGASSHRAPLEEEEAVEEVESVRARTDCADGCGTCVDPSIGSALPDLRGDGSGSSVTFLDRFFARAAALPPPPVHRKMSFDPDGYNGILADGRRTAVWIWNR